MVKAQGSGGPRRRNRMLGVQSAILQRLADARRETDRLFDVIRPGAIYERPIPERHRIIFYLGHLETFDWNLLRDRLLGAQSFDPEFDRLFAFGIDPVGGGLPTDQPGDWPSVAQVHKYRRRLRQTIDSALEGISFNESNTETADHEFPATLLLNVAIEHRLMHAETLCYMLHQLPLADKIPPYKSRPEIASSQITKQMIQIPDGTATLG